jgi:modulator of FtsH protease HflK
VIRGAAWAALAVLVLGWLATGVMMVDTGQKALVYRFGAITRVAGAGLHLRLPWPVEVDERLNVTEVRRVELPSSRLLTADTNLVQLSLVVQYTVGDPASWALATDRPEDVISGLVQSAAMSSAAAMTVDVLLTTGRADLERQLMQACQQLVDARQLGVRLVAVDVRELVPPGPVVDAFNDVSSARGDRETLALSAEAYASKLLPDVRGAAAQLGEQARSGAAQRVAECRSDTARFEQLYEAWRMDRGATRVELHALALEAVAPHLKVIAAPEGAEITLPLAGAQP